MQKYCQVVEWCNLQVLYDFWDYVQMLLGSSACSPQDWVDCSGKQCSFMCCRYSWATHLPTHFNVRFVRSLMVVLTAVFSNLMHLWIILLYKYRQNIVLESQIAVYSLNIKPSFTSCKTRGSLTGAAVLWSCFVCRLVTDASIDPTGLWIVSL
jgi:hypothetical protein